MGVGKGSQKFWGRWGPTPRLGGDVADPLKRALSPRVIVPTYIALGQKIRRRYAIRRKIGSLASHLSQSLKVIEADTDRSATYNSLLVFYSHYGPIYPFPRDFGRKSQQQKTFSTPCI